MSDKITASFRWEAIRIGNVGYVTEHRPDGSSEQWEMPANHVPNFVSGRRAVVRLMMERVGAKHTGSIEEGSEEGFDYLEEGKKLQ